MIEKKNISIIIADDHPIILKGLYDGLITNSYNVIGQASTGLEALNLILRHNPKIAMLDIHMPMLTGFEVIKRAKEQNVDTKFIILSFHKETNYISKAKTMHLNGYLLKEDSFSEIEDCIEKVLNDEIYFSKSFEPASLLLVSEDLRRIKHLTSSEKTVLKLVSQQMSSILIAETLFISTRTVEKHRSNIITKLELENTTNALTNWAYIHRNVIKEL